MHLCARRLNSNYVTYVNYIASEINDEDCYNPEFCHKETYCPNVFFYRTSISFGNGRFIRATFGTVT